ncbi:MAG: glycoside hydrolase family 3 N-terminal domain-containing protein [Gemmobacter sp.]
MTAGATILAPEGPALGRAEAAFLREADPWGFILFARNIVDAPQLRALTDTLRGAVGRDAPVFIDQEGGRVQRLRPPLARDWSPPLDHAGAAADPIRALWLRHRIIAAELRGLGIDGNCAPCCDIAGPDTHPFLRNRCLGTDAATVTRRARAAADGLLAGGVLPVVKHIPGHGRATADSHLALPRVETPLPRLAETDFAPFAALADLPLAMTAHVVYTALDPDRAATLSPAVMAAIRGAIGFAGLVMTDDMSMQALSGDLGALTSAAIAAGCDVALHCNGRRDEMAAVVAAAGRLTPAAAARADRALAARRAPDAADLAALAAELARLGGDV